MFVFSHKNFISVAHKNYDMAFNNNFLIMTLVSSSLYAVNFPINIIRCVSTVRREVEKRMRSESAKKILALNFYNFYDKNKLMWLINFRDISVC